MSTTWRALCVDDVAGNICYGPSFLKTLPSVHWLFTSLSSPPALTTIGWGLTNRQLSIVMQRYTIHMGTVYRVTGQGVLSCMTKFVSVLRAKAKAKSMDQSQARTGSERF